MADSNGSAFEEDRMKRIVFFVLGSAALAGSVISGMAIRSGHAEEPTAAIYVTKIPEGYRDWKLVSVAREEGELDDIRAILGNDKAIKAFRDGKIPFPDGTTIARIAWAYDASEVNNKTFGRQQSFVAGNPKNGVQFMVRDSKKYAATGGWGYGQFDDGVAADDSVMKACFPCHQLIKQRDYVFTHYSR
jgi:hypothetical protein